VTEHNVLFSFEDFTLDVARRELKRGGAAVALEPQVFDLLVYLIENRDRVVSRDDLIAAVWNGRVVSESTLASRINAARQALGDSGEAQRLIKTIQRKGVRFAGEAREAETPPAAATTPPATAFAVPDRPSIAVLPFTNLSGDIEQDYFADGVTEEIIIALSRVRGFFVIARHSTFAYKNRPIDAKQAAGELGVRYVLSGSVRRAGDRVRVSAQLIDGATGNNIWARSYDRALPDIFALQDEITHTIVGAIEPELGRAERERATVKARDLDAWSIYQRGMTRLYRYTREDLAEARTLFRQAIAVDPGLGPAHSGIAEAYFYEAVYGFAPSLDANRDKAIAPATQAVALDREDAAAHCTLGRIRYFRREYEAGISELRTALEINPSLALAHYGLGAAFVFSGRPAEAFVHLDAAIRFSPYDPNMGSFLVRIAEAKHLTGDDEGAVTFALRAINQPHFQWSRYSVLIAALGQLGRVDEAQRYLNEITRVRPDYSIDFVRTMHPFSADMGIERYYDGLRKAGVPQTRTQA
jgi:TolB-like protein/Flp pilus assembly protein TadD